MLGIKGFNVIKDIIINQHKRLTQQFGWAISSIRVDTTYSGRALLDIKPIIDKTLGGVVSKDIKQLDNDIEQISFLIPPHQIIPLNQKPIIDLELDIIQSAYQLGAFDCCRYSYGKDYVALNVYFGGTTNKTLIMDEPLIQSQIQIINIDEIKNIVDEAKRFGFLSYLFKPTSLAADWQKKHWIPKDVSLLPDGTRNNIRTIKQDNLYGKRNFVFGVK